MIMIMIHNDVNDADGDDDLDHPEPIGLKCPNARLLKPPERRCCSDTVPPCLRRLRYAQAGCIYQSFGSIDHSLCTGNENELCLRRSR